MLPAIEPDLHTTDSRHPVRELRPNSQHGLPIHGRRGPVVRTTDDAFHSAFRAGHKEAHGWTFGEEERGGHIACGVLDFLSHY